VASVGDELGDESSLGQVTEGVGPSCGSGTQTGCWDFWGNFGAFDITAGLECGVVPNPKPGGGNTWSIVDCYVARGTGKDPTRYRVNWGPADDVIPGGDIKSLALFTAYLRDAAVFILGSDNKVRVSGGRIDGNFYAGFQNVTEYMQPVDTSGNALCLKQIIWVTLPSFFAPNGTLLALTCGGSVYARTTQNNVWKWTPAANAGLPWNRLPAGTWLEISHGTRGAYLLSSNRSVLKLGDGVATANGVTWDNARWLSLAAVPAGWKVQHVGGQFILVGPDNEVCVNGNSCPNDRWRVMRWSGQSYSATSQGTASAPNDGVMPWDGIVDAANFNGRAGGYGLHHSFQRVYSYRP
jgi:hypothetical protein